MFEMLLCELWGKTISYRTHIKKKDKDIEQELLETIPYLEKQPIIHSDLLHHPKKITRKNTRKEMEGVIIRSKAKGVQKGGNQSNTFVIFIIEILYLKPC